MTSLLFIMVPYYKVLAKKVKRTQHKRVVSVFLFGVKSRHRGRMDSDVTTIICLKGNSSSASDWTNSNVSDTCYMSGGTPEAYPTRCSSASQIQESLRTQEAGKRLISRFQTPKKKRK